MRRHVDLLMAAALLVAAQIELALADDLEHRAAYTVLASLVTAVVAVRRRFPLAAMLTAAAAYSVAGFFGLIIRTTPEVIAFIVLVFTAAEALPRARAVAGLAIAAAGLTVEAIGKDEATDIIFVFFVFLLPPWLAGRAVRDRNRRLEELERLRGELEAEEARAKALAAEAERARIARDMHDALSHSVGLMTLQAGAGERLAETDPAAARDTLRTIADAGHRALAELEGLIADADAPPDLETLVGGVRAAGLTVTLRRETAREPPAPVALAAQRIVQEALTNVVKHARASHVSVVVTSDGEAVDVSVEDDGRGGGDGGGTGRGLIGMRERVAAYNGHLEAGVKPGGGFAVRAHLPVEAR